MTRPAGNLSPPGRPQVTGTTATGRTCHPRVTPTDRNTPEGTRADATTSSSQTHSHQHGHQRTGAGPTTRQARSGPHN